MLVYYRLWQTEEFEEWLENETARSRYQIDSRLDKIRFDNHFGTRKNVSEEDKGDLKDKVWELKFNDGRRIYYAQILEEDILLLLGGNKNGQTKDIAKAKNFTLRTRKQGPKRNHMHKKLHETERVMREGAKVKEYNPTKNLLDTQKMGAAIMECLIENDTEGALEVIEIYLEAVNRTNFLEKAKIPRSTAYNFFKRRNPTIKTLAKIMYSAAH